MSYLNFVNNVPDAKGKLTRVWDVQSTHGVPLGQIRWYAPWRKYTFVPSAGTVWDENCLTEIAQFAGSATLAHKTSFMSGVGV